MKRLLLATVAASSLAIASPAVAQSDGRTDTIDADVEYSNDIDVEIEIVSDFDKYVNLVGTVDLRGLIRADSAAVAINDVKQWQQDQIIEDNEVNVVETFDVAGSGNLGVNLAAGIYNQQMNSAALAISDANSGEDDNRAGGWAEAATISLQHLTDTEYQTLYQLDDDRLVVQGGTVTGAGNIGVNATAGAFNQQSNLMTMAVATDSVLAEANAALVQLSQGNTSYDITGPHRVGSLTLTGASGNIGVNMSAGVGNQQVNSLTMAVGSGNGGGGGGGGGGDDI
ncbi:hypothetical protein [Sphingomonas xanthus]|uniref:Uncharacterized protein n=1 Tax=Sphingomonas xanthus TaxID=2594473 RepID=A0A516INR5_9SPHN|nr:hypothetical protein [Sphingomonas xanthus]QDP18496.1 hypothetical protein FMM02_00090 [Sphingomonas xanthus]